MLTKHGFTLYSLEEFDQWLQATRFNRAITLVQNHHTWLPDYGSFSGSNHFALLKGMHDAHLERGFDMIAQNLTTFPDGTVAVCRPLDRVPAGIKGANSSGICIEHLGNFDGKDTMTEEHRKTIVSVNALLCREFGLTPTPASIVYHHWYDLNTGKRTDGSGATKSCPGTRFFGGNSVAAAETGFIPLIRTAHAASVPAVNPSASPAGRQAIVTASTLLNVRNAPNAAATIIGSLKRGAMVNIYASLDGWHRIHPRDEHWASARYLAFTG